MLVSGLLCGPRDARTITNLLRFTPNQLPQAPDSENATEVGAAHLYLQRQQIRVPLRLTCCAACLSGGKGGVGGARPGADHGCH